MFGDDTVVKPNDDTFSHRSASDQAFVVSRWFARGGCVMNYVCLRHTYTLDVTCADEILSLTNSMLRCLSMFSICIMVGIGNKTHARETDGRTETVVKPKTHIFLFCSVSGGNHYGHWAADGVATKLRQLRQLNVGWTAESTQVSLDSLAHTDDVRSTRVHLLTVCYRFVPNRYSHLTRLHNIIRDVAQYVVTMPAQYNLSVALYYSLTGDGDWTIGTQQVAFVYNNVVFIESSASVPLYVRDLKNNSYYVTANSLLIFHNDKLIFNTSDVQAPTQERVYTPINSAFNWSVYQEPIFCPLDDCPQAIEEHQVFARAGSAGPPVYKSASPLEQLNITRDLTDNMWYEVKFSLSQAIANDTLTLTGAVANAYAVFLDGAHLGDVYDTQHRGDSAKVAFTLKVANVAAGDHILSILSVSLGIGNGIGVDRPPAYDHYKGIVGQNTIGQTVISGRWTMRAYTVGEFLSIYTLDGAANVEWSTQPVRNAALTWYRSAFQPPLPSDTSELMLSAASGVGRGHIWINGHDIGRYWTILGGSSGVPTQRLYHIPRDWLALQGQSNIITVFEEIGAQDIDQIGFTLVSMQDIPKQTHSATA